MFCEWIIPKSGGDFTWPDDYFDRPWIRTHEWIEGRWWPFTQPPISPAVIEGLRPARGDLVIDVILNTKFLHSAAIAANLFTSGRWKQAIQIPVFTWLTETTLDRGLHELKTVAAESLQIASLLAGPLLVLNEYDRKEVERLAMKYLQPGVVDQAMDRVYVVHPVFDAAQIDARDYKRDRDRKQKVLFHGGSLGAKRMVEPMLEAVVEQSLPVDVVLKTQNAAKPDRFPPAVTEGNVNHSRYIATLGEGDIQFIGAYYEGTGLGYMEGIWSGMLPIALDAEWVRYRLPDGYPFIVSDWREFGDAVRIMVEKYDSIYREWMPRLRERLGRYTPEYAAKQFADAVDRESAAGHNLKLATKLKPGFDLLQAGVLEEAWTEIRSYDFVRDEMRKRSEKGLNFKWLTDLALHWMLQAAGYEDMMGPEVHYRRKENDD